MTVTPQAIARAYASGASYRALMRTEKMQYRTLRAILDEYGVATRRPGGAHTGKIKDPVRHYCQERKRDCTLDPSAVQCASCCAGYMVELIVDTSRMTTTEDFCL